MLQLQCEDLNRRKGDTIRRAPHAINAATPKMYAVTSAEQALGKTRRFSPFTLVTPGTRFSSIGLSVLKTLKTYFSFLLCQ